MPKFKILGGSWTRGTGRGRKTFGKGDVVECSEESAKVFGQQLLERLPPEPAKPASEALGAAPASAPTPAPAKASEVPTKASEPTTKPAPAPMAPKPTKK
jgi:hypothetical protein